MSNGFLPPPSNDGLFVSSVGNWVEDKHTLVGLYDHLFSTGMKNKWNCRVYIELYAGSGLAQIRDSQRFVWGSPMIALGLKDPFDRYIFCEENPQSLEALKRRVGRHFPNADVHFVPGDCNERIEQVCELIPKASKTYRVLSFCFIDPYDLSIRFSTIETISRFFVDFLILLALHMDANRNKEFYLDGRNRKLDDFLGVSDWRERWASLKEAKSFPRFLAEEYARRMNTLGYLPEGFDKMKQIRSDLRNLPLYHLALFSRHALAFEYWDEVLKYSTSQMRFDGL